jgi:hypothetical protein
MIADAAPDSVRHLRRHDTGISDSDPSLTGSQYQQPAGGPFAQAGCCQKLDIKPPSEL